MALRHKVQLLGSLKVGMQNKTLYFNVTKVFIFNNIFVLFAWMITSVCVVFSHDTFAIDLQQNDLLIVSFFILYCFL